MGETHTSIATDPVIQFSVYSENRVGRLHDLTSLFGKHQVHIMALTVLDTTDAAIIRMIVDDVDKARELMINNDFPFSESNILVVEVPDESHLQRVLASLLEAEININYIYSLIKRPDNNAGLALHVEDPETAAQALCQRGFKVLTQHDIAR